MDVSRSIPPKASSEYRFIFMVVHYSTKSTVSKFLKKEIICQYRMPKRIISNNALNLNNSTASKVYSLFKINITSPQNERYNGGNLKKK
ncbi:receptor-like protein 12 [Gossypium australe]|uniref:Receptor-like protein 12 n=1 Tax=Gossypium australe TaxID=47621 RepID=A0A5B6USW4_9ROSI|nr:receptor-like protein 12 [Gossypium australe]